MECSGNLTSKRQQYHQQIRRQKKQTALKIVRKEVLSGKRVSDMRVSNIAKEIMQLNNQQHQSNIGQTLRILKQMQDLSSEALNNNLLLDFICKAITQSQDKRILQTSHQLFISFTSCSDDIVLNELDHLIFVLESTHSLSLFKNIVCITTWNIDEKSRLFTSLCDCISRQNYQTNDHLNYISSFIEDRTKMHPQTFSYLLNTLENFKTLDFKIDPEKKILSLPKQNWYFKISICEKVLNCILESIQIHQQSKKIIFKHNGFMKKLKLIINTYNQLALFEKKSKDLLQKYQEQKSSQKKIQFDQMKQQQSRTYESLSNWETWNSFKKSVLLLIILFFQSTPEEQLMDSFKIVFSQNIQDSGNDLIYEMIKLCLICIPPSDVFGLVLRIIQMLIENSHLNNLLDNGMIDLMVTIVLVRKDVLGKIKMQTAITLIEIIISVKQDQSLIKLHKKSVFQVLIDGLKKGESQIVNKSLYCLLVLKDRQFDINNVLIQQQNMLAILQKLLNHQDEGISAKAQMVLKHFQKGKQAPQNNLKFDN